MHELLRLLTEFGADETLIGLATRFLSDDDTVEVLTDEELVTFHDALVALGDDETASNALLLEAVAGVEQIRTVQTEREAAAIADEAEREAARAALRGDAPAETATDDGDGPDDDDGDEPPAEGDDDGENADATEDALEPVTASGRPASARRRPPTPARNRPAVGVPAGARIAIIDDIDGVARAGGEVEGLRQVDTALRVRSEAFRGGHRGAPEYVTVARVHANYPEDRRLHAENSPAANGRIIDEALAAGSRMSGAAVVAAGGLCAPATPYYGVPIYGDARRPVRDSLVGFQATRGGIISVAPPTLPDLAGSVILWTHENDTTPSDPATKPCLAISCGSPRSTQIDAIPLCLTFGNFNARTFGEWDNAWSELGMIAHARFAEQNLLTEIKAASKKPNNVDAQISAIIDILGMLARAAERRRSFHRMREDYPFRAILPSVVRAMLVEDLARRMPGGASNFENLLVSQDRIDSFFASRYINVTWSPDMNVATVQNTSQALQAWPTTAIEMALFPEGQFLFLDGGELDLGIVRDSTTNKTNAFQTFVETFEALHMLGPADLALWLNIDLCVRGAVVGTLDPDDFCAGLT